QFYAITVDNETPYNVYGGLQDNGVWKGAHNIKDDTAWHATGHNAWTRILGGDGMYVQVDNRNSNTVYTGFQFGNYYRLDLAKKRSKRIQPKHVLGEAPYRFNWQSPILLSQHNQDILYFGGNKLHRSLNQGDDWETISPDLTTGGKKGNVAYGTLTTISESPFQFGLLYTGSDDGLAYRSDNGGGTWEVISDNFPKGLWVSRVIASAHDKDLVYVTLNGYRSDDFTPYVFKSIDRGKSWTAIASNLPDSPVNVIREDPENKNILYLGNDQGVYISFDQGNIWEAFSTGLTAAAVHDIVVQSKAKHLVVGTHGRSIYIGDISKIQKVTPKLLNESLHLFELESVKHSQYWGQKRSPWSKPRTPEITAMIYSIKKATYSLTVKNKEGLVLYQNSGTLSHGFNQLNYDLSVDKNGEKNHVKRYKKKPLNVADNNVIYLSKGTYSYEITTSNGKQQTPLILN
ncbi:glycosyl hydrolase, partial [Flavobacteriaceae bacterium]|nr:glycosyl hydrolase [Flavobacteriaceae bacterium]